MKNPFSLKAATSAAPMSVRDLSEEARADALSLLEDGSLPSQVAQELGLPLGLVQALRRSQIRQREEKTAQNAPQGPRGGDVDAMRSMLVRQIEMAELEARLEKIKSDNAFEAEKRALDLKIKRLELRARELEIEDSQAPDLPDMAEAVAGGDDVNLFGFLTTLLKKNGAGERAQAAPVADVYDTYRVDPTPSPAPPSPPAGPVDVTKPLSDEQIDAEIAKATPEDLEKIAAYPASLVRHSLRERYPGITDKNLYRIMDRLKPSQKSLK